MKPPVEGDTMTAGESPGQAQDGGPSHHGWWLVIVIAVSGWAYVDIWVSNRAVLASFYPGRFAIWVTAISAIGLGIAWLLQRLLGGSRRWDRPYAVAIIAVLMLQSWKSIGELVSRLAVTSSHAASFLLVGIGGTIAIWLAIRLVDRHPRSRAVIGVLAAFLVGYQYLVVAQFGIARALNDAGSDRTPAPADIADSPPDVLLVVLDGYGRSDVLADGFGYDNTPFEEELSRHGLQTVEGAKTHYTLTTLSVASVLDGRYPALGLPDDSTRSELQLIHAGDNALFNSLRASGYEVHLFDNAWTFTRCGDSVDVCHTTPLNELDHAVLARTPVPALLPDLRVNPTVRGSVEQLRQAVDVVSTSTARPRLTYLHALIPHTPLQLDAQCQERFDPSLSRFEIGTSGAVPRAAYIEQLRCVNDLVSDLVAAAPADAVILITSDHGPRWAGTDPAKDPDATDLEALARIGTFTAVRFPDTCATVPNGAPLMIVSSLLFDCLGVPIDVERERDPRQPPRYFSQTRAGEGFDVVEITERVSLLP
ncbi:MAG: LTA synthase family protein [Acidimicrobiia bacterium]|nr:LTA synthase family protein [Acidimicrobiia bacterium]